MNIDRHLNVSYGSGTLVNSPTSPKDEFEHLSPGGDCHPHGNDPAQKSRQTSQHEEEPSSQKMWEKLHTAMEKYDEGMLNRWNSNMNNLLIFAGLFSAVVTAFIIESYQWLQADPADGTLEVLRQISAQLAGSSPSASAALANSTASPSSLTVPPYAPSSTQVTVNVLWFSSLAMSLVAALFAILVQQWLQEYPLRGIVTMGKSGVRIRQYRYDALHRWGVPDLVAILPVLLQIALILFFVGLLNLLWSLNKVVAGTIAAVLIVPAVFLVASSTLPLIRMSCSYKSPLSIMVYTVCQMTMVGVIDGIHFLFVGLGYILTKSANSFEAVIDTISRRAHLSWSWHVDAARKITDRYILPWTASFFIRAQHYHLRLSSRRQLAIRDIGEAQKIESLDQRALAWGHHAMPSGELLELEICLKELRPNHRAKCVLAWTEMTIGFNDWTPRGGSLAIDRMFTVQRTFVGLDEQVVKRLRRLLSDETVTMAARFDLKKLKKEQYFLPSAAGPILLVLRQLVKLDPRPSDEFMHTYTMALITSLGKLDVSGYAEGPRILARCMFECWHQCDPQLDDQQLTGIADHVFKLKIMSPITSSRRIQATLHGDALITFVAALLLQHARRASSAPCTPGFLNAKIVPLIQALHDFTKADKGRLTVINGISFPCSKEGQKISFPVWPSLCDSLFILASKYRQLQSEGVMQELVRELVSAFDGKTNSRTDAAYKPLRSLVHMCAPDLEKAESSLWRLRPEDMIEVFNDLNVHAVHLRLRGAHRAKDRFRALLRRPPIVTADLEADGVDSDSKAERALPSETLPDITIIS